LLAGIAGSLELLAQRLAQGRLNDAERYIVAASGAAKRAASLTQRLLAFARRQTLDAKPTDINRHIVDMEELIRRTMGPDMRIETVSRSVSHERIDLLITDVGLPGGLNGRQMADAARRSRVAPRSSERPALSRVHLSGGSLPSYFP